MIDKAIPQGQDGHLDHSQEAWLRLMPDGWDGTSVVAENARLKAEKDELVELVCRIWNAARLMQANEHIAGMRITDEFRSECEAKFAKLGIDVDEPWETMEDDE